MRICVVGASGIGKSTFIKDFLANWPSYKSTGPTYRDLVKEKGLSLNKEGNAKSQEIILNCLLDEAMKYKETDNVIHDRGVMDNVAYTLWLKSKDKGGIDDHFLQRSFHLMKNSMIFYDIIFYIPYDDKFNKEERENRELDTVYNTEVDNFFKAMLEMYYEKSTALFPFDDDKGVPAIIDIFGSRRERIEIAKLYVDPDGKAFTEDKSLIADVFSR